MIHSKQAEYIFLHGWEFISLRRKPIYVNNLNGIVLKICSMLFCSYKQYTKYNHDFLIILIISGDSSGHE